MNTLVIGRYENLKMGFLLEDSRLVETINCSGDSILGNVYTARVVKIVKNIDAAFLDAGLGDTLYYSLKDNEKRHIFLRHMANTDKVCEGDVLLVQIARDPVKTKKAEASANIEFTGKNVVINRLGVIGVSKKIDASSKRDELKNLVEDIFEKEKKENELWDECSGAVVRTGAATESEEDIREETIKLLCKQKDIIAASTNRNAGVLIYENADKFMNSVEEIKRRFPEGGLNIIEDDDAIDKLDIDTKLMKLMKRVVNLPNGGCLYVDTTEAMTVIDVNSGKAISGKDKERSFLKINMEAADMIARVLKVRNLSGMVIIDFISMKDPESYRTLIGHIKDVISKDPVRTVYVDTTGLGLVELTRQKKARPLHELLRIK